MSAWWTAICHNSYEGHSMTSAVYCRRSWWRSCHTGRRRPSTRCRTTPASPACWQRAAPRSSSGARGSIRVARDQQLKINLSSDGRWRHVMVRGHNDASEIQSVCTMLYRSAATYSRSVYLATIIDDHQQKWASVGIANETSCTNFGTKKPKRQSDASECGLAYAAAAAAAAAALSQCVKWWQY